MALVSPAVTDGCTLTAYHDYAHVLMRIQTVLEENYNMSFKLYASDGGREDYWDLLEMDVKSCDPAVQLVTRIFDYIESTAFSLEEGRKDASYEIYPVLMNHVFAYPGWGVALARVPMFRAHGIGWSDMMWAAGDASLKSFLDHSRKRRRDLDRSQVTVFTDGPDGVEKELSPITKMVERTDVVMGDDVKKEIYRSIDQFFAQDRQFFHEYAIPYRRGILLYGKPGNGKTTLVKSIAGSVKAPVAYWQITEYTNSDSIQEVFQAAANMAPMILVIEDIDSMPERSRSYFLNLLDGATSREGIFLIGTTNYPEKIDPALMNRAGRFDRAYEIKLPDAELRFTYLRQTGLGKLLTEDMLRETARLTGGFTFAQLNELYVSAALEWHYERTTNVEKLVKTMKADLHKGQTQTWMKETSETRVGFIAT
ncbi:ATP-binding protein [Paenibacillus thalictri]|uniref:ATP-binding protein n=2 Tax=Paenibacillus thalictri TaxID=2527873 RepID=A0A4Q9DV43_9BACL|nr:ATP-binding protein [Paenibacillus thalictri]